MARIVLRPTVLGFSALALWCAHGCLAPGSLENEALYRIEGDGAPSGQAGSGEAQAPGCVAACTTFHTTCSTEGCHTASNPAAQLDLESPGVIGRMTNAPAQSAPCFDQTLLVPGDTAKSLVYKKLIAKPACGLRMPLTGPLSASDIDCVRRWVLSPSCDDEGAPDASVGSGGMGASGSDAGTGGAPGQGGTAGAGMGGSGGKGSGGRGSGGKGSGGKGNGGAAGSGGMPAGGGMSGAGGQPPVGVVFYVEGEAAALIDPMATGDAADASGGKYVSVPTGTKVDDPTMSTMGIATFTLNVTTAGDYVAFARVIAMSTSSDSFWVKMDGGDWVQWNNITNGTTWVWDDVHDTAQMDAPVHYQLSAGTHTFVVAYREAGAQIDKLAFATDPAFMPTGLGQ